MALVYDKATYDALYSAVAWEHGVRGITRTPRHRYNWFVNTQLSMGRMRLLAQKFTQLPGWAQMSDIAIIGGGFGWTAEVLLEADPSLNFVIVETSPHVINTQNTSEEADLRQYLTDDGFDPDNIDFLYDPVTDTTLTNTEAWAQWLRPGNIRSAVTILDNDLSTNGQRRNVRQQLGNNIDLLLTEAALDGFETEAEIDNFLDNVENTRPNPACTVLHYIEYAPASAFAPWNFISKTLADWGTYLDTRGYSDHWIMDTMGAYQRADGSTI